MTQCTKKQSSCCRSYLVGTELHLALFISFKGNNSMIKRMIKRTPKMIGDKVVVNVFNLPSPHNTCFALFL